MIKYSPKEFEKQIIEMCKDLDYFRMHGADFCEGCEAEKLIEALSDFHNVVVKPLIDEERHHHPSTSE